MPPANSSVASTSTLWRSVDALIDRAPGLGSLQAHGVLLLAAQRYRAVGRPLPEAVLQAERTARVGALSVPALLARARSAYSGRMIVFKGPVVANMYPNSARGFVDVDLLVDDAAAAQRQLIAAGFFEVEEPELFADIHHLRPLMWPGLPLKVEVHSRPKWPDGLEAPANDELFAEAVDGHAGVEGVLWPARAHHAMLLAAHGWAHSPLRSLRDLIDVAAVSDRLDRAELAALARRWDLERVWRATTRGIDSILLEACRRPMSTRLWAAHLPAARERTVLETHLEHWIGPLWGLPPRAAIAQGVGSFVYDLKPVAGEPWRDKLKRTCYALRRSAVPRSEHEEQLGEMATRGDLGRIIRERRAEAGR
jgi:hypothetical protein